MFFSESFQYLDRIRSQTPSDAQAEAARAVIKRLLPDKHDVFTINVNTTNVKDGKDSFSVSCIDLYYL